MSRHGMVLAIAMVGALLAPPAPATAAPGTTIRITEIEGVDADGPTLGTPTHSSDGRFVSFTSSATNLAPGSAGIDQAYVVDLVTGEIEKVSVGPGGEEAEATAFHSAISTGASSSLPPPRAT